MACTASDLLRLDRPGAAPQNPPLFGLPDFKDKMGQSRW